MRVTSFRFASFANISSFQLQRRLSGDKAAAAHGVRRWIADEFGTLAGAKMMATKTADYTNVTGADMRPEFCVLAYLVPRQKLIT